MTTNTSLEVVGVRDAIRSLNKIEPGLRKQFTKDATRIAQPAIQEVQKGYSVRFLCLAWPANGNKSTRRYSRSLWQRQSQASS
jgi:hypothetical protein